MRPLFYTIPIGVNNTEKTRIEESLRQTSLKLILLTSLTRHDIINQLSVIHATMGAVLSLTADEKASGYLNTAQEAGFRIENIIGITRDYENFGFISSGWRSVHAIIDAAKLEVSSDTLEIRNETPEEIEIYADSNIRKFFSTLIENTIRYGKKATYIRFFCENHDSNLCIISTDDSVGIPDQEKEHIFLHGYESYTGLGLFLAKEILSITDISMKENGIAGIGSRFEILVPEGRYRKAP